MLYADFSNDEIRRRLILGDPDAISEALRRYERSIRTLLRAFGVADADKALQLAVLEALADGNSATSLWETLQQAAARASRRLGTARA